jgi:hypothetical protein
MTPRPRLRYIELITGHQHDGPAWVAFANASKSGAQLYFNGKALKRVEGDRHIDTANGDVYWAAAVKKEGTNRHREGRGIISIEKSALPSYLRLVGMTEIDANHFVVIDDLPPTDASQFEPPPKAAGEDKPGEPAA